MMPTLSGTEKLHTVPKHIMLSNTALPDVNA